MQAPRCDPPQAGLCQHYLLQKLKSYITLDKYIWESVWRVNFASNVGWRRVSVEYDWKDGNGTLHHILINRPVTKLDLFETSPVGYSVKPWHTDEQKRLALASEEIDHLNIVCHFESAPGYPAEELPPKYPWTEGDDSGGGGGGQESLYPVTVIGSAYPSDGGTVTPETQRKNGRSGELLTFDLDKPVAAQGYRFLRWEWQPESSWELLSKMNSGISVNFRATGGFAQHRVRAVFHKMTGMPIFGSGNTILYGSNNKVLCDA